MSSDRSPDGPMAVWLKQDLESTSQDWIIAFFHHPPYTKGSHNSDNPTGSDRELLEMREGILPILEAGGVDLVALEEGPGVVVGVGGVHPADEVPGQAVLLLQPVEGLERRGGEHPAEIPDHSLDRHAALQTRESGRTLESDGLTCKNAACSCPTGSAGRSAWASTRSPA